MGLDVGLKRTGVALSDPMQLIASPLETVPTLELMDFLQGFLKGQALDFIVLGDPVQMDGTPSESAALVQSVGDKIRARWPELAVHRQDERFTSRMAARTLKDMRVPKKKRRQKGVLDPMSAALILQDFLDGRTG